MAQGLTELYNNLKRRGRGKRSESGLWKLSGSRSPERCVEEGLGLTMNGGHLKVNIEALQGLGFVKAFGLEGLGPEACRGFGEESPGRKDSFRVSCL